MILLFNMYLLSVDELLETVLSNPEPEDVSKEKDLAGKLKVRLNKLIRYVKYCMVMLELACSTRARRQELIYRCHFDFVFIAALNYLYSQLDALSLANTSSTKSHYSATIEVVETAAIQLGAFLPTLVVSVDRQHKNFAIMVRMKRQKFPVKCTSLSYKLIMDTLLFDGAPVCELETLDVHKVDTTHTERSDRSRQPLVVCAEGAVCCDRPQKQKDAQPVVCYRR